VTWLDAREDSLIERASAVIAAADTAVAG